MNSELLDELIAKMGENETMSTKDIANHLNLSVKNTREFLELRNDVEKFGYHSKKDGLQYLDFYGENPPKSLSLIWQFNCTY